MKHLSAQDNVGNCELSLFLFLRNVPQSSNDVQRGYIWEKIAIGKFFHVNASNKKFNFN